MDPSDYHVLLANDIQARLDEIPGKPFGKAGRFSIDGQYVILGNAGKTLDYYPWDISSAYWSALTVSRVASPTGSRCRYR